MLNDSHKIAELERKVASMAQLLNGCTPQQVIDYTGYIYSVLGQGVGYRDVVVSSAALPLPWDIDLQGAGTPDPETGEYTSYTATVNPGLIGGILPSNWNDEFNVPSGLSYMVVECQSDGKVVTTATISNDTEIPTSQNPTLNTAPDTFKILFAVLKDGKAIRTLREGHISVNTVVVLTTPSDNPLPGLNVLDRHYVWGLMP